MSRRIAWIARFAYIAVIAFATVAAPGPSRDVTAGLDRALDTSISGRDAIDGLRNIALFAGWGAVWTITSPTGPAVPILARATASGLGLSATAEGLQLAAPSRTASVLDLITNTVGAFLGGLLAAIVIVFLQAGLGRRSYVGMPIALFALGYGGSAIGEAFSPFFRQQLMPWVPGGLDGRLTFALDHVEPIAAGLPFLESVLFVPAGFFAVAALAEFGISYRRGATIAAVIGALACATAEVAHGIAGYPIYNGAILVHAVAIAIGALLAVLSVPVFTREARGAVRPFVLFWSYTLLLALWYLRPFTPVLTLAELRDNISPGRFIPLLSYREKVDVFSVTDALVPVMQLVPLGALLAVWPMRRTGPAAGIMAGLYVVVVLETSQIFIIGRFFDITDVLIGAAALGLYPARRASV